MNIYLYLGNLLIRDIEKRLGIELKEEYVSFMQENHQATASNIQKGKWHCFDIPFNIVCGDVETAKKIYNAVKDQSAKCKESLRFSVYGG